VNTADRLKALLDEQLHLYTGKIPPSFKQYEDLYALADDLLHEIERSA
jgi:hypothetical protein